MGQFWFAFEKPRDSHDILKAFQVPKILIITNQMYVINFFLILKISTIFFFSSFH